MRILIFIDALGVGGKERQTAELLKGLGRNPDLQVQLVCMEQEGFLLSELEGLRLSQVHLPRRFRWDPFLLVRTIRHARRFRPQVIHTNNWVSSFYALAAARLTGAGLVNGSIRNAFPSRGWRWHFERLLLSMSDIRLANSRAGLRSRKFSRKDPRNVVVHNGFDLKRLQAMGRPPEIAGLQGKKVVGMVATFKDHKDHETYIEAARRILTRRRDVVFVAVGDGERMEHCRNLAPREGFLFLGKRKGVLEVVSTFDVGVLSTYTEGISNAVMEYMALGKPVVVTDGGGSRELVVHEQTGFLIPAKSPQLLCERIELLIDQPALAIRMGKAGKERLGRHFSVQKMVSETIKVYEMANKRKEKHPDAEKGLKHLARSGS